jgi:hypothetical protein
VRNREIWDFVAGPPVREVLRVLLLGVRRRGVARRLPFRCDAPGRRRRMEMDVAPGPMGGVTIRTRVLAEERDAPAAGAFPGGPLVDVCAWCLNLRVEGRWGEPEEAIRRRGLLSTAAYGVRHVICPVCEGTPTA